MHDTAGKTDFYSFVTSSSEVLMRIVVLAAVALAPAVAQAQAITRHDGIEYRLVSIRRMGTFMQHGNARIQAPPGREVVELALQIKPITSKTCCAAKDLVLETVKGDTAESIWGEMESEGPITLELPFIAPSGSKFKALHVNGVMIELSKIASERTEAPKPKLSKPT